MSMLQIHQFSPSANYGDGITNGMFYLQKIIKKLGFISQIYAQKIQSELEGIIYYEEFDKTNPNQILFIHYSIYYDFAPWIDTLNVKKHLIYHNITPPVFFKNNKFLYEMCKKGIEALPSLACKFEGAIGDSSLNATQLKELNFKNIHTIPLLVDMQRIMNTSWNKNLYEKIVGDFNIIFVGRIARNKSQHDLIKIANIYKYMCDDFKMYIIGGTTDKEYELELIELIKEYGLQENVVLTGKVSNQDLYAYYRGANIFLCMSEHEGFGIPLIEAMLFHTPVVACDNSSVADTLNGGGVLFAKKSLIHIAAMISLIRENPNLKYEILKTQERAISVFRYDNIIKKLVDYLSFFDISIEYSPPKDTQHVAYQFEGPFDSSYSLAILNKNAAMTFESRFKGQVSLYSLEGYGDIKPDKTFLAENPQIKQLFDKSQKAINTEVSFRNCYPPNVAGMSSKINILNSYGWEESAFPKEYVKSFNENLNGIIAVSDYVKKVLINNAVKVPIQVINNPVDHLLHVEPKSYQLKTSKSFRFLHISSCFPRKGIEMLLESYMETFTKDDDVVLIIKTFPNPHNKIEKQILDVQKRFTNYPAVEVINKDLDEAYIVWLYQNSNALIAPSYGEGFGLPMAEAMLFNLPVITTGYGGQADFCTEDTSWLIDYSFEASKTHMNLFDSYWVKPSIKSLSYLLKQQTTLSTKEKEQKTLRAKKFVLKELTWDNYLQKTLSFIDELKNQEVFSQKKVNLAWISSYNTKCGIAAYSEFLLGYFKKENIKIYANYTEEMLDEQKESNVIRCWKDRFDVDNKLLIKEILAANTTHVVINFNFAFFSMQNLKEMLQLFFKHKIKTTIIFHSVNDVTIKGLEASLSQISEALEHVNSLLVHSIKELNVLKSFSLLNNVSLLPHGVYPRAKIAKSKKNKPPITIASYGFLLPQKGIKELIVAFGLAQKNLTNTKLLLVNALYPLDISKEYLQLCKEVIKELGLTDKVDFVTDFLNYEESCDFLDRASLIVLPYGKTYESSSAAVRHAISTCKPVLCTKQPIFDDVSDVVHFTKDFSIEGLASSMVELLSDEKLLSSKASLQKKWINEHSWDIVSCTLKNIIDNQ